MAWIYSLTKWLESALGISPDAAIRVGASILVLLIYALARKIALRILGRTASDPTSPYQINKAIGYLFGFVAIAVLGRIWIQGVTGLATYLGLLSAGIAVALQDPIINLAGWIFIVSRGPFKVGDRIQIA